MDILNGSNHQVHACNCCNFFRSINDVFQRKKKAIKISQLLQHDQEEILGLNYKKKHFKVVTFFSLLVKSPWHFERSPFNILLCNKKNNIVSFQ